MLTTAGRKRFAGLDARANAEIGSMIGAMPPALQRELVSSMRTAERALGGGRVATPAVVLRQPRAGDYGWVIHRHGALYAEEYGWDVRFEALVADIVAKFVRDLKPARERCWIAEVDGEIVGSVFLCERSKTVGQLRLLYVEPTVRGMGIGGTLTDACLAFAREAGYRRVVLWTNSVLHAARRIYERAGFQLIEEEAHRDFGPRLLAQTWSLTLGRQSRKGS